MFETLWTELVPAIGPIATILLLSNVYFISKLANDIRATREMVGTLKDGIIADLGKLRERVAVLEATKN